MSASKHLPVVFGLGTFFIFAVLLYVRPLLEATSVTPYRPVYDPYQHAYCAHYTLKDSFVGYDFFSGFKFETFDDPTHGRVNYVDQGTAMNKNLTQAMDDKFFMRADSQNVVPASARGRDSIRITSYSAYADSVVVLDVSHMPEGCATWPAFWTLSQAGPWPQGGEIDILEGVNQATHNLASLHSTGSCAMPQSRFQTGTTISTNCDANANFNQGCGTQFSSAQSYGSLFNSGGGGWYVMARSKDNGIRVWFWSRNDDRVPDEVKQSHGLIGTTSISPDPSWGTPNAAFPMGDNCDYNSHFNAHQLVFDLTFCGDWAGADFSTSGCGGNCDDYVNNSPESFANAYWEVNALRVYTP